MSRVGLAGWLSCPLPPKKTRGWIIDFRHSSTSTAVGHESSYTWEGANTAACDEILWGILTLNRAMQAMQDGDELEPVNVSLKVRLASVRVSWRCARLRERGGLNLGT